MDIWNTVIDLPKALGVFKQSYNALKKKTSQNDVQKAISVHAGAAYSVPTGRCEHILSHRESPGTGTEGWGKTGKTWNPKWVDYQ